MCRMGGKGASVTRWGVSGLGVSCASVSVVSLGFL